MTDYFIVALTGSPFGLTGRVKIVSLSGETDHLLDLKKVRLRKGAQSSCAKDDEKTQLKGEYQIEEVFASPLSIKFKGVDSLEAAKALRGAEILVPREEAAPLNEGEFYIEDLRGLEVIFQGKPAGTVSDIIEGGGGFLAEVFLVSGEKRLVPFRDEFFGLVDTVAGRMELLQPWIIE